MRNWEKLRHLGFRAALQQNIVAEPRWRSSLNLGWFRWAFSQEHLHSDIPCRGKFDQPERSPLSQRYWENTRGLLQAPQGITPWVAEVARIYIPDEFIGVLKGFEQVLVQTEIQGETGWMTASAAWGNPFNLPTDTEITWHFRVHRLRGTSPTWINASSAAPETLLPGEPHPDLPSTTSLWYPAASPVSQNFHLHIGGGYTLRVVSVLTRDSQVDVSIAGKIRGFQIGNYSLQTREATRSNW